MALAAGGLVALLSATYAFGRRSGRLEVLEDPKRSYERNAKLADQARGFRRVLESIAGPMAADSPAPTDDARSVARAALRQAGNE